MQCERAQMNGAQAVGRLFEGTWGEEWPVEEDEAIEHVEACQDSKMCGELRNIVKKVVLSTEFKTGVSRFIAFRRLELSLMNYQNDLSERTGKRSFTT